MDVHLPPELERFIQNKVQSGEGETETDGISDGLRLMEGCPRPAVPTQTELRSKIAAGYDSLRRGESIDGDQFFAELEREEQDLRDKHI